MRKEETSTEPEGSNMVVWAWETKEVVGAESPESGGGASEGAAGIGRRPVIESQIEAIAGRGGGGSDIRGMFLWEGERGGGRRGRGE